MSLRLSLPAGVIDPRLHRDDDMALSRSATQQPQHPRTMKPAVLDTPAEGAALAATRAVTSNPSRRRVVLPDPVAFRFLEGDPSVQVVERRHVLPGYELYLVEQWACSRQSPTVVIATYTGDPKHSIVVGVLEVPAEDKDWSPRLRVYFKAMHQYHARPKETDIGELMVTNLSSFPSALTVIAVPEGDIRKHRQIFIVNEDLKRLGCSGRSGLSLAEPTAATQAKFMQMYKTSDRIPFIQAVLELVKLCQSALFMFGMLEEEYIDGLLCDVTEKAINDWWTEIGSEYFNIEPADGILGPTTVAALLGSLLGARNRLSYSGAPVSKDVFDIECTKRGIGTFQKSMRLERTRRLDRQTMLKLHSMTAKAAAGEGGWGVQKAVKSTVAEIGGKRGEIVIGMVGRDKANIGDIESLDLGKFINLAYGERPKWLWHGKPRRAVHEHEPEHPVSAFGKELRDDLGPQLGGWRTHSTPPDDESDARRKEDSPAGSITPLQTTTSLPAGGEVPVDKDALRKTVFKSVAGKVSDARSGLGRIRDAVGGGLRGHVSRPSKDEGADYSSPSISMLARSSTAVTSPVAVGKAFLWKVKSEDYPSSTLNKDDESGDAAAGLTLLAPTSLDEQLAAKQPPRLPPQPLETLNEKEALECALAEPPKGVRSTDVSAPGSVAADNDLRQPLLALDETPIDPLQRRHSIDSLASLTQQPNPSRLPRRLSFSIAEDAILCSPDDDGDDELVPLADDATAHAELARAMYAHLQLLQSRFAPWVSTGAASVAVLNQTLDAQQTELRGLHASVEEGYARARHGGEELVAEERARLGDAVRDVEVLAAKLEYEIGALVSRVAEVEDGVAHFEAQVVDVERRAGELKKVLETESWVHWFVRSVTGIGTGPNIVRG
ncbi:hypothetical protein C8A05DRAFT_12344 [Staphylotrichum tortipilum]|uniref:STB6-like N-terminal domain-containing protein n=1 Tax=Staphylotrichum tortipilum TaxID=2831512 RepID=A0AAN6MTU9_9PEZI|nr:hypothetical protein C8A05DRAFT_12344 [Staphylotrichum longicolle]